VSGQNRIEQAKLPIIGQLVELRKCLLWSLALIFVALIGRFWFAKPIYNILLWPYRQAAGVDPPIELIHTAP